MPEFGTVLFNANGYPSPIRPWKCPFNHRAVEGISSNWKIDVITNRAWVPWRNRNNYSYNDVEVDVIVSPFAPLFGFFPRGPLYRYTRELAIRLDTFFMDGQIRRSCQKPDLVHSVAIGPHSFAAQKAADRWGVPHIVQLIGGDVMCLPSTLGRSNLFTAWTKRVSLFVSNSDSLATTFKTKCHYEKTIQTVYRGVDLSNFKPKSNNDIQSQNRSRCRLLYLGGNIQECFDQPGGDQKGADVLLRAWQKVLNVKGSQASLLIGGPLINPKGFESFRESLREPDSVELVGTLPAKEIPRLLQSVDVVVIPSRSEGLPNVCLESMASGIPVIATSVGGLPEVIEDDVNGWLVNAGDSNELAEKIHSVISDKSKRVRIAKEARCTMEQRFDREQYGRQMTKVYQHLISQ